MTKKEILAASVAPMLFILMGVSILVQKEDLAIALFCVLFLWVMIRIGAEDSRADAAWEERYAHMSDDAKIDHHLDRARRYGTNHDANIAQALIERKRK